MCDATNMGFSGNKIKIRLRTCANRYFVVTVIIWRT